MYLTGGATAVLIGWRESTIDVDIKLVPETDELLREIPSLKERLQINVELASPDQFIPVREGWRKSGLPFTDSLPSIRRRSSSECGPSLQIRHEQGHGPAAVALG